MNKKKKNSNKHGLTFKIFSDVINRRYPNKFKILKLPNENILSKTHGVSRSSLRESLKVLQSKGIISSKQKTGTEINEISNWNFFDRDILTWTQNSKYSLDIAKYFHETRLIIEPETIFISANRIKKKQKTQLEIVYNNLYKAVKNQDTESIIRYDLEFHKTILYSTENPILLSLNSLINHILKYNFELNQMQKDAYEVWKIALPLHNKLKNQIISHKAKQARRTMYAIINNTNKIS